VAADIRHPLFARVFDRLSRTMEKDVGPYRDELLAGLSGRVVEIGPGNGSNFRHYPDPVTELVAVEPEPYLRSKAARAAESVAINVTVRAGTADSLGLADETMDAAVSSLVLCSVRDQAAALGEIRRVLKPGGQLRFLEHVRAPTRKARVQAMLDATIWPRLGGGCHCGRDTLAAIRDAGFTVERVRSANLGPGWMFTNPHVIGRAARG
jgi:ubiquinone/menaquinone biosynthesis C-methylase UbiE